MSETITGVVEYIDDNLATIDIGEYEQIEFPVVRLPKNTKEGDYLRIVIAQDPEARKSAQRDDIELGGFHKQLDYISSKGT